MTGRRAFLRLSLPFFHDPVHGGEACQERPGGQRPLLLTQGFLSPWVCLIVPAPSAVILPWGRPVYFGAVSCGSGCSEDLPEAEIFSDLL